MTLVRTVLIPALLGGLATWTITSVPDGYIGIAIGSCTAVAYCTGLFLRD